MTLKGRRFPIVLTVALILFGPRASSRAFDVVISGQGEYADAYLVTGNGLPARVALNTPDPAVPNSLTGRPPFAGRHLNGHVCFFPKHFGHNGQYVMADDTYREACLDTSTPQARCSVTRRGNKFFIGKDPDGWGVFKRNGKWRRQMIHAMWPGFETLVPGHGAGRCSGGTNDGQQCFDNNGCPSGGTCIRDPQGTIDPQGCVFDGHGNLWGNDVGNGDPTVMDPNQRGSLLVFFPGPRHKYDTYCFLDKTLHQAGQPTMDEAGNVYLAETGMGHMWKYSPPLPTSAADCNNPDHLVTTAPTKTLFPTPSSPTPGAIVRVPGTDHWYIDSVLFPGVPGQGGGSIDEYDANGVLVRNIAPPTSLKNPLGMSVGSDGTLYYAELNLNTDTSTGCGRVSRIRFVNGTPQAPEVLGQNLAFPDGVTVVDSSKLRVNFLRLPPGVETCQPSSMGGAFLN